MDDLVLVKKLSRAEILEGTRTGRPQRTKFSLRNYSSKSSCLLALPASVYQEGDKAEFYLSNHGFAIQLTPDGSRLITGKKNTRTASVPKEIRERLDGLVEGSVDMVPQEMPDRIYFFAFHQFLQQ